MGTERAVDPMGADWITWVILAVLVQLALTNAADPRKWTVLLQAGSRMRLGVRSLREDIDIGDRWLLNLWLAGQVSLGLFLYQAALLHGILRPSWHGAALIVLALIIISIGQFMLQRLMAWLFMGDGGTQEYGHVIHMSWVTTGLLLFPLVVAMAYLPDSRGHATWVGLGCVALLLIYRWVRAFPIGLSGGVRAGHIFIYLCASETLPLALLLRGLHHLGPLRTVLTP